MKRIVTFLSLLLALSLYVPVMAASVPAQYFPGNDANDYTPPEGCLHYQIPNSDEEGSHTISFDSDGLVDPDGPYTFTVVVGTLPGNEYTQVLSWSSNFPIYAVIVKGGNGFNLYQYDESVRGDTDLKSPVNPSGNPANVSHVSVVICPDSFPPQPPTPTPTPEPTVTPTPTVTPAPVPPCPCPCSPDPPICSIIVIMIFQIISTILLGILVLLMMLLLFGSGFNLFSSCIRRRFYNKLCKPKKIDYHDKNKDCDHKKDKECKNKDDNYKDKYDPCKEYPLDCNKSNSYPNDYNKNNF